VRRNHLGAAETRSAAMQLQLFVRRPPWAYTTGLGSSIQHWN